MWRMRFTRSLTGTAGTAGTAVIRAVLLTAFAAAPMFADSDVRALLEAEGLSIAEERLEAPDFTLESLDGVQRSLSSYRGSVVFLNFWASWCVPCRVEMPSMERLHRTINDERFVILAVDLREERELVEEFAEELGLSFPILLDPRGITGLVYGVRAIPTTYLVDKQGRLTARLIGSREWDTPGFESALRRLMDEVD